MKYFRDNWVPCSKISLWDFNQVSSDAYSDVERDYSLACVLNSPSVWKSKGLWVSCTRHLKSFRNTRRDRFNQIKVISLLCNNQAYKLKQLAKHLQIRGRDLSCPRFKSLAKCFITFWPSSCIVVAALLSPLASCSMASVPRFCSSSSTLRAPGSGRGPGSGRVSGSGLDLQPSAVAPRIGLSSLSLAKVIRNEWRAS